MTVPNQFGTATSAIPLSQLDANFDTPITLGNTAIQLGNTVTTLNNMTFANVTISSGNVTITNVAITTANVSGTANISTLVVVGNATVGGNTTITGNITAANANVTTNLVLSNGTANGVAYLNVAKVLTTGSALTWDGSQFKVNVGTNLNVTVQASSTSVRLNYANDAGSANVDAAFRASNYIYQDGTGAESLRLTSTSLYTASTINVGIGTSSPTGYRLNVVAAFATGIGGAYIEAGEYNQSVMVLNHTNASVASNLFQVQKSGTGVLTLDASGNLGIGNTNPGSFDATGRQLVVGNGNASQGMTIYSSAATAGSIFFAKGTTGADAYRGFIQYGQSGSSAPDAMIFGTAATERARIDSSGNLLQVPVTTASGALITSLSATGGTATVNSATYTVNMSASAKLFYVYLASGDAALVFTSYLSSSITFLGITPTSIVASASPSSAQLGISKSANSHDIVIKTGSALSSVAASWVMGSLSSVVA